MHGNNPTSDSIERALDFAVSEGLIRSWKQVPFAGGARHAKWEVEVHPNVHSADGLGTYVLRTYQEAKLFCAALISARCGLRAKIDDMQQNLDQLGDLVGRYQDALGIEPGADPGELLDNETGPL
jgi:hypothetical protein